MVAAFAQPGGGVIWGIFPPRNFQNIAIAILTFTETFKEYRWNFIF